MSEETSISECTLCATYYKTFRKLRRHFKKRHADLEVLEYYFCDYMTHDKIMFKQHKEYFHADQKFVCKKCVFKTRKWTRMERHFDKHKTTKPVTELLSSQDLGSNSRLKEAAHSTMRVKEAVHSTSRVKEAVHSTMRVKEAVHYTSRVKEDVHSNSRMKEAVHSTSRVKEAVQEIIQKLTKEEKIEEKLFVCDFCEKHFQSKIKLKEHVQVHSQEHPFKCTLGKDEQKTKSINEFSSPEHLNLSCTVNGSDHSTSGVKETVQEMIEEIKKQEMEEKRFVCEICKKRFQHKSNLTQHSTVHTEERPYKCTLCEYAGKWKSCLTVHMRVHTDERPFKCTFCEYKAKKRGDLKEHIKIHLNQRDFACEICDKKSYTKHHLKLHMRVHTGEKPFKCHVCERGFSQIHVLKKHLKSIHFVPFRKETLK